MSAIFAHIYDAGQYEGLVMIVTFMYQTLPVWLPVFLFVVFIEVWLRYRRTAFILKEGSTLLEIKLPQNIDKSPAAMEIILTALHQAGKADFLKTFLGGAVRPWFSLELVSIDGQIHFYIWTRPKFKKLVESQIYAQYPGIEIYEAEDYTKNIFWDPEKRFLWGTSFKLNKDDVYPIKTYVDYGLDQPGIKEEYKIDPMTSILEFLGSLKKGEQIWIQILIQAHRKETLKDDARIFEKPDWSKAGKNEIKAKIAEVKAGDSPRPPTEGERMLINALERSLSKFPFDVGIRGMYVAEKSAMDGIAITALIGSFRQYNDNTLNGFKLAKATTFDLPWQDFRGIRRTKREKKLLNSYKLRSYFNLPYRHLFNSPFILNTEELATIFHFPGQVASTPTLPKTPSRKSEAPPNLPI